VKFAFPGAWDSAVGHVVTGQKKLDEFEVEVEVEVEDEVEVEFPVKVDDDDCARASSMSPAARRPFRRCLRTLLFNMAH
jgi:hypothetical protein